MTFIRRTGLALTLVLAAAVTACSTGEDAGFEGTGPIYFADARDTSRGSQITRLVDEWNRGNPSERVEMVELAESTTEMRAQMVKQAQDAGAASGAAVSGPTCYDVIAVDVAWTTEFARWNYILPLDEDAIDHDAFLRKPLESARYDGKLWAVPLRSDVGLLYYRKDLLGGLPVPRTWEELRQRARTIAPRHAGPQGYITQLNRYEGFTVNTLESIWDTGGDVLGSDGSVTDPRGDTTKGFGRLLQGVREGWISPRSVDFNEEGTRSAFQEGTALFMRNWTYAYELLRAGDSPVAGKFDVARLPTPSALGGWNLALSRCSQRRATALRFMRFLSSEKSERALFTGAGFAPSRKALYEDRALLARYPQLRIIREAIEDSRNRGTSPYYHRVSDAFQSRLYDVLVGAAPLDARMDALLGDLHRATEGR